MPDNDFTVRLEGDVSSFTSGMNEAATAATTAAEGMTSAFQGVGDDAFSAMVQSVKDAMAEIEAAIAAAGDVVPDLSGLEEMNNAMDEATSKAAEAGEELSGSMEHGAEGVKEGAEGAGEGMNELKEKS